MNTGVYNGLVLMLSRFMGVGPGVQVRKYYRGGESTTTSADTAAMLLEQNEFVNTIVDITADDVCIGCAPFYLQGADEVTSPELCARYSRLIQAVNKIAKWAAVDLLKRGYSLYSFTEQEVEDRPTGVVTRIPVFLPVLGMARFWMRKDGGVDVYVDGERTASDLFTFLNYSKESLVPIKDAADVPKDGSYLYEVSPTPIQLNNVAGVVSDLSQVERAIYRYRVQLSRIVRFAQVEAGVQIGNDGNSLAVDNAAAAVNANSQSMDAVMLDPYMSYDDNLPIVPIRNSVGKIDVVSDIPDFSMIKELPDLEYTLNRLFLAMRFPKSYADFNTALDDTAVSLIRGDIRYARMVDYTRSVMEEAVNRRLFGPTFDATTAKISAKLTALPNSEDDDVVEALGNFQNFASESIDFINAAETKEEAEVRLKSITVLLGSTANLASIQNWGSLMSDYIDHKFAAGAPDNEAPDEGMDGSSDADAPDNDGDSAEDVNPDNEGPAAFDLPATE